MLLLVGLGTVLLGALVVWRRVNLLIRGVAASLELPVRLLRARGHVHGHPVVLSPRLRPDRGTMALVGVPIGWAISMWIAYLILNVVVPVVGNFLGLLLSVATVLGITLGAGTLLVGATVAIRLTVDGDFGFRAASTASRALRIDQNDEGTTITFATNARSLTGVHELDHGMALEGPDIRVMSRVAHARALAAEVKSGVRIEPGQAWLEWTPLLAVGKARARATSFMQLVEALLKPVDDEQVVFELTQSDRRPEVQLRAAAALLAERPKHPRTRALSNQSDPVAALSMGGLDALVALHTLRRSGRPRHIEAIEAVEWDGLFAMAASNTIAAIHARQGDSVGQLTEASKNPEGGLSEASDHAGAVSAVEDPAGS